MCVTGRRHVDIRTAGTRYFTVHKGLLEGLQQAGTTGAISTDGARVPARDSSGKINISNAMYNQRTYNAGSLV